jgi:hypothetical protein
MAYYGLLDWAMTIHHFMCIVSLCSSLISDTTANLLLCAMFVAEISNPPMHFRAILRQVGLRYSQLYEIMELTFLILYMFGRIVMGPVAVWKLCTCSSALLVIQLGAIGVVL